MKTIDDVMQDLKVSRRTIYRWMSDPDSRFPKPEKIGKQLRWDDSQIDGFKNLKLRVDFDAETGVLIQTAAILNGLSISDFVIDVIADGIIQKTQKNHLYPIDWNWIEKREMEQGKEEIPLSFYVEMYCNYILGLQGAKNIRFDILKGTGPDAVLLKGQSVLPLAQRELLSIEDMKSMKYRVVNVYKVEEK